MRLGVTVELDQVPADRLAALVAGCEQAGLDLVLLRDHRGGTSLAPAAACAAVTSTLLVACEVAVTDGSPLYLAEERHVADQLLGGRLVTVLAASDDAPATRLAEWSEVLLAAAGTRPFRHAGAEHRIPAGLPENTVNLEEQVRVTPAPFALEPVLWTAGTGAGSVAATLGLSPLVGPDGSDAAHTRWTLVEESLGKAVLRLRRPAVRTWSPTDEDAVDLAARLLGERDTWGLDTTLVTLVDVVPGEPAWASALSDLMHTVAPRLQQHRLPSGLEDLWAADHSERTRARPNREAST